MDLHNFISNHPNFIDEFRKNGFFVKNKKNLCLIKYDYSREDFKESWMRYCKGCIIDKTTKKIVCLSPIKSLDYNDQDITEKYIIQDLIDGTMINIFHNGTEWIMSTRGDIGGKNKWGSKKSFMDLVNDCCDYDKLCSNLKIGYSYSFVLRHELNRNISRINENSMTLVDIYDMNTLDGVHLDNHFSNDDLSFNIIDSLNKDIPELINSKLDIDWKGFTIKTKTNRYKYINPNYNKIKNIKKNSNSLLYTFVNARKNGKLHVYLSSYKEHKILFDKYKKYLHIMTKELYDNYSNVFILKKQDKKEIPYQLKPLVYGLHDIYHQTHNKITFMKTIDYVNNLPSPKLTFVLKYYIK